MTPWRDENLIHTLSADGLFRLPFPVRPGLLDAMSFEDTETALSRLFGGLLPAQGARPVVTGPGGAPDARPGDFPPVRFGHPRPNRTGQDPVPAVEPTGEEPQWTKAAAAPDGVPVTRLGRGAATLADVLRAAADVPVSNGQGHSTSTEDGHVRADAGQASWPGQQARAETEHHELNGPGSDASGSVHSEPGGHIPASATPVRLEPPDVEDDPWPRADALADVVLERLRDEVELEFQRVYGLGEG